MFPPPEYSLDPFQLRLLHTSKPLITLIIGIRFIPRHFNARLTLRQPPTKPKWTLHRPAVGLVGKEGNLLGVNEARKLSLRLIRALGIRTSATCGGLGLDAGELIHRFIHWLFSGLGLFKYYWFLCWFILFSLHCCNWNSDWSQMLNAAKHVPTNASMINSRELLDPAVVGVPCTWSPYRQGQVAPDQGSSSSQYHDLRGLLLTTGNNRFV